MATIVEAHDPERLQPVRELFREYADSLPFSLCFQGFEQELATLPGRYAPPSGRLFLAMEGTEAVGCIASRHIGPGPICEMKRLYVRPRARATGLGRALAVRLLEAARADGYERMRLDTSHDMIAARGLYVSLGFVPIDRYNDDPVAGTIWMELVLTRTGAPLAGPTS